MSIGRWLRHPVVWLPVSAALIAAMLWRSRIWDAGDRLSLVDPMALAIAVGISFVIPVAWAARSADLLRGAGRPVAIGPLVPMTLFANTINNLTPGSSGEVVRVWLLRAHHAVEPAISVAVVAIERLVAFGYLAGSAAIVWIAHAGGWPPVVVLLLVALLVAAPGVVYAVGVRPSGVIATLPLGRLLGRSRWAAWTTWLRDVDSTVGRLMAHPLRLAVFAVLTAGVFAGYTAQLVLVARALGADLDPIAAWGALGISITAGILSLLPFGLGSTDLVLVALLGVLGVDAPGAAAITLGYRLVSTLPLGLGGVASYAWLSARLPNRRDGGILGAMRADADPDAAP